ncbi:MAG TPA: PPOX class F420-dependent oxidoreductase [Acidimicrobiales bacterium]|nr:PPOX class F420-dependent oxidoreductase [Acidimicrobiales bacterium]
MDIDEALAFVRANHQGVLATTRADGGTQMTPVTPGVDDEGRVEISSRETAFKVAHLRARPRAALCVFTEQFYGPWVQLEGPVEILSLPEALEPLVALYRRIQGEHPDWDDYRAAMVRDRRVVIRLTPERAGPNASG